MGLTGTLFALGLIAYMAYDCIHGFVCLWRETRDEGRED